MFKQGVSFSTISMFLFTYSIRAKEILKSISLQKLE